MHNIICSSPANISALSIAGVEISDQDLFDGDWPDEPCDLTHEDIAQYVDADDRDGDDERPDSGGVMRLSEAYPEPFWAYFDRFIRYWLRKTYHVKHAYEKGFIEKKRRGSGQSLPLFDALAVELAERHLNAWNWAEWKGDKYPHDPIWLALYMPKLTTVDLIDVDAKQFRMGYYRECGSDKGRLMPVIHLPLDHFKRLKRIYDAFPGRIWCISSETLGIHAWKKHASPQPAIQLHQQNKNCLAGIGEASTESHPMPGRCLRRPFGDGYRTITPTGICEDWIEQVEYFESDGRTPTFNRICHELVKAMYRQWQCWERWGDVNRKVNVRKVLEQHWHELQEIADWLKAGCPLEQVPVVPIPQVLHPSLALSREVLAETLGETSPQKPDPILRICRAILSVSFGEKTDKDVAPILEEASAEINGSPYEVRSCHNKSLPNSGSKRDDLASLRGGNWAKELLRLARVGLEQEDSVGTVVHEMAKWLWWIELYSIPEGKRLEEITGLLNAFVMKKHNGCVSRLLNGQEEEVIAQVARCVKEAATITLPSSLEGFAQTRQKWLNGGYTHPVKLIPALTGDEDVSLSPSCQFTVMCINFDDPLPESVQGKIKAAAGRTKVMNFATRLINLLYNKQGKAFVGRKALSDLLGYENPNQIAKYVNILERAGIITRGSSYKAGRNGKGYYLRDTVMNEMREARMSGNKRQVVA